MICCENCFVDSEIKAIIQSLDTAGDCDICNSRNIMIYDTQSENKLVTYFNELLSIYEPKSSLPTNFPTEKLSVLKDILYNEWNIFLDTIDTEKIFGLVKNICSEKYQDYPELFEEPIGIINSIDENFLNEVSILKNNKWEDFVDEIKTKNRFHTQYINTDALRKLLGSIEKPLKKGTKFYRARISEKEGFSPTDMYAPLQRRQQQEELIHLA